jgi:hypothetical protein
MQQQLQLLLWYFIFGTVCPAMKFKIIHWYIDRLPVLVVVSILLETSRCTSTVDVNDCEYSVRAVG